MFNSLYHVDPKKAFEEFKTLAAKHGLVASDCGHGHWQLRGGARIVNYYPSKGTVYVCGDSGSKRHCPPERAIQAALASTASQKLPEHTAGVVASKQAETSVQQAGEYQPKGGFLADKDFS